MRRLVVSLAVAAGFIALAVALTWPLASQLTSHVPGSALDDNLVNFWNYWWMRHVLSSGLAGFFYTTYQFYPGGADLVLHAHTATDAWLGATIFGRLPIIAAMNLTLVLTAALNGFAAYLLAYRVTKHRPASIVAGVFFAASPCLTAHLYGHFNYYTAWVLPLFALTTLNAIERSSWRWSALAGIVLAVVAYTDYYYLIYAGVLVVIVVVARWIQIDVRRIAAGRRTFLDNLLLTLGLVAVATSIWVARTGGGVFHIGSMRVSLTTGFNVRAFASIVLLIWIVRRYPFRARLRRTAQPIARDLAMTGILGATFLALIAPMGVAAVHLVQSGHYVSQIYTWRSAPEGLDVGTLVAGNPFSSLWGSTVRRVYQLADMDRFVGPLWLGVVPSVFLVITWSTWRTRAEARVWKAIGVVFFVWALGPHLQVFGINTALPLPQLLLRYVPIVSNARIPSHAVILVYLAAAVILAIAIATARIRKSTPWIVGIAGLTLLDFFPAPIPTVSIDRPPVYETLASLPDAGLLEVPFGIRDAFGEYGSFDPRALYYQSIHGKPIVGGYTARLSRTIIADYNETSVLNTLMRLSARNEPVDLPFDAGPRAAQFLKERGVRYVVVNTQKANPAVRQYVALMALQLIASDATHELYRLQ